MILWIKLFGSQYFGFWGLGLVCFLLQELPYLVMLLFPLHTNPIMQMQESSALLDLKEQILGSLCIVWMVFLVEEHAVLFSVKQSTERWCFIFAVIFLLLNFLGWSLYFLGYQSLFVMIFFLAAMPPLYYFMIGLWRNNFILCMTASGFFIVHVLHVYQNLKLG